MSAAAPDSVDRMARPGAIYLDTPQQALGAVFSSFGDGAVILIGRLPDSTELDLGQITPFGSIVRSWRDVTPDFLGRFVAETVEANAGPVFVVDRQTTQKGEGQRILAQFAQRKPDIPSILENGRQWAHWWSLAPLDPQHPFVHGDRLGVTAEYADGVTILRYRHADSRNGGVHCVLHRGLSSAEAEIVQRSEAVVERYVLGRQRDVSATLTQLLMLKIPHELARAFDDGRLPLKMNRMIS